MRRGEVHPARASLDVAPVVGTAAAGGLPVDAHGPVASGPVRPTLPGEVQKEARRLLLKTRSNIDGDDLGLRQAILTFIGDFAAWDLSADATYLEVARGLIKAAHGEETPLVVDPFAGGGSIPLRGIRLGCDTFASDLNPVACFINKVLLEDIPRARPELASELRRMRAEAKKTVQAQLAEFYPADPDGAHPIAYLSARNRWLRVATLRCRNTSDPFVLVEREDIAKTRVHVAVKHDRENAPGLAFRVFEPTNEKEVHGGTVNRAKATCPCCGSVVHPDRVRAQLAAKRGGRT